MIKAENLKGLALRFVMPCTIAVLVLAGSVAAQKLKMNPSSNGVKFATPVVVTFDNPNDYDSFAAGRLLLNVSLHNPASGQTLKFKPTLLTEAFKPMADKRQITIYFVIDNLVEPLGDCLAAIPSARNNADGRGVDITLTYARCGGKRDNPSNMTAGQPIKGIIVKGGKNPGGNMNISVGNTTSFTGEAFSPPRSDMSIVGPVYSNKGSGSPKQAGF